MKSFIHRKQFFQNQQIFFLQRKKKVKNKGEKKKKKKPSYKDNFLPEYKNLYVEVRGFYYF